MALRGKKPELVEKRLKALFFGQAGVGKTTAAIQFPRPYLIDTERGAENPQYVALLEKAGGAYFFTADFDELMREITALMTERHEYRTLVIDPLTVIYNDIADRAARRLEEIARRKGDNEHDGTEFSRHKKFADRVIKRLLNMLLRLDMNVVITSHAKDKWVKVGDEFKSEGSTYDCYGKLDYLFDLACEVQKRGKERVGVVRKTRIVSFPEGEVFPFTYDEIANRYGREVLERAAQTAPLASAETVAKLKHLVALLKVPEETTAKWLAKAQAEEWEEMPADAAVACIKWMEQRIANPEPAVAAAQ